MSEDGKVSTDSSSERGESRVLDGGSGGEGHEETEGARKPDLPPPHYVASSGTVWLASIAIVIALTSVAGVIGLGWAWYQVRGMDNQVVELQGTVNGLKNQLQTLSNNAATKDHLSQLEQNFSQYRQRQKAFNSALTKEQENLRHDVADGLTRYREQEAASLMRIASYRLTLGRDVQGSISAMLLARQALDGLADPRLMTVRMALDEEIKKLQDVPKPDVAGLYAQLQALSRESSTLPLAQQDFRTKPKPMTQGPSKSWWARIGTALKRAFSPLFVVRHGVPGKPILTSQQEYFTREELRFMLEKSEIALLRTDSPVYRGSLQQAQLWVRRWFNTSAPTVKATLRQIGRLQRANLSPQFPKLGHALELLQGLSRKSAG